MELAILGAVGVSASVLWLWSSHGRAILRYFRAYRAMRAAQDRRNKIVSLARDYVTRFRSSVGKPPVSLPAFLAGLRASTPGTSVQAPRSWMGFAAATPSTLESEESVARRELSHMGIRVGDAFVYTFAAACAFRLTLWFYRRGYVRKEALQGIELSLNKAEIFTEIGIVSALFFKLSSAPLRAIQQSLRAMRIADRIDRAESGTSNPGLGAEEDVGWLSMFPKLIDEHRWLIFATLAVMGIFALRAYSEWVKSKVDEGFVRYATRAVVDEKGSVEERLTRLPAPKDRVPSGKDVDNNQNRRRQRFVVDADDLRMIATQEVMTDTPPFNGTCAVPFYNDKGAVMGYGAHVRLDGKTMVMSVAHVLERNAFWDSKSKKPVEIEHVWRDFPGYKDQIVVCKPATGVALTKAHDITRLDEISFCLVQKGVGGPLSPGLGGLVERATAKGQVLVHLCSTDYGWSGLPVYAVQSGRWTLVGLHHGGSEGEKSNVSLPFFA